MGVLLTSFVMLATLSPAVHADAATKHKWKKANDGAKITKVKKLKSWEWDVSVKSPALHKTVKVRMIFPKGWQLNKKKHFPAVFAFHGGRANYTSWTNLGHIQTIARKWKAIVVMPEGSNGSYTNWVKSPNSSPPPHWETFHMKEVMQLVKRNFHVGKNLADLGLSSGGQGAIYYAEKYPRTFKATSAYSSILHLTSGLLPYVLEYTVLDVTASDPSAVWGDPATTAGAKNWQAHDPYVLLPRLKGTGTRVYVTSGTQPLPDIRNAAAFAEYYTGRTTQDFLQHAQSLGIPVSSHIYGNGLHEWKYWIREMNVDYPHIMAALHAKKA